MIAHVPGNTPDAHEELLAQLHGLLPSAFLDGELDRDALLSALGLGDDAKPAFMFTWPGLDRARQDARAATTALVPDKDASLSWEVARDVLIEGDNLQVLKLLKNGYSRAVKLIYIDPPYNTGDTFTYNDDFAVPERQYLEETGQVDEQGNATTSRIESGGRKHAPWLTMMFPRLALARHLPVGITYARLWRDAHRLSCHLASAGCCRARDAQWNRRRRSSSAPAGGGAGIVPAAARWAAAAISTSSSTNA
jgi:adenine-specific DNA-methyltransferase